MSALFDITAVGLLADFSDTRNDGSLGRLLTSRCKILGRKNPQPSEISAWNQSLPALAEELVAAGLGDVVLFIEFAMPPWREHADVILAGPGADHGRPVYTLVELKQWTDFEVRGRGGVMAGFKRGKPASKPHPWEQATRHVAYLTELYAVLDRQYFQPMVFLHNATDDFMTRLRNVRHGLGSTMFGAGEKTALRSRLRQWYSTGSSAEAARLLRQARVRQSEVLLKRMDAEFDRTAKDRFVLLGEQWEAYQLVAEAAEQAALAERKAAVIVHGRPGTGKTAVALKLAGESFRQGRGVYYWVWQTAFREALVRHSGLTTNDAKQLFRSPREKKITERSMRLSADISICDEAHRLEKRTSLQSHRRETDQIDDILSTSMVHVFFVDDDQQVKMTEIGTVDRLREDLESRGVTVFEIELTTQVRSGGVKAYVDWVRRLVGLEPETPGLWEQREDFRLWVAEQPDEVERILHALAEERERYRITAGICWDSTDDGYGSVTIGDWSRQWNLKKAAEDGPEAKRWAWDTGGWRQIGCVHTAQGLEWEWAGAIIGRDLIWRGSHAVPVLENNTDLPSYRTREDDRRRAEKLLRNAYYILMTRGMRGMVIYAEDNLLRAELRSLVQPLPLPLGAEPEIKENRIFRNLPEQLIDVVHQVHGEGVSLPHMGIEYVPGHRSKLAWREQRVVILRDDLDPETAANAISAYGDAGWEARKASDWDADSLRSALLRDLDSAGTVSRRRRP
ncbi:DNA/RNA helicase domain-containing protein [Glycomyces halotolerans]